MRIVAGKDAYLKASSAAPSFVRSEWLNKSSEQITVGVISPEYGLEHVSYGMSIPDVKFGRLRSISARRFNRSNEFWSQAPLILGPRVDLIHTFNKLPIQYPTARPFVVSAELELPRILGPSTAWQENWSLSSLENPACRRILALSDAAAAYMCKRFCLMDREEIIDKVTVFRGAVYESALVRRYQNTGVTRCLFVGGDGLRKGMSVAVNAVKRMRKSGINAELTVIGHPTESSYVLPNEVICAKQLRDDLISADWISFFNRVPNSEVRRIMSSSDVLLLPTIDDSLGWVIIEAAMEGLPTIAPSIFAIPELIENEKTGWLLSVDTDDDGRWTHLGKSGSVEKWHELQEDLINQIVGLGSRIFEKKEVVYQAGIDAREYLSSLYAPKKASIELLSIYREAVA